MIRRRRSQRVRSEVICGIQSENFDHGCATTLRRQGARFAFAICHAKPGLRLVKDGRNDCKAEALVNCTYCFEERGSLSRMHEHLTSVLQLYNLLADPTFYMVRPSSGSTSTVSSEFHMFSTQRGTIK